MNTAHPSAAIDALRRLSEGTGGATTIVCGEVPSRFYAGAQREAASTLLEAVLTFLGDAGYDEIVLFAGRGRHLPPLQAGPTVRLGAARSVIYLRRPQPSEPAAPASPSLPTGKGRFLADLGGRSRRRQAVSGYRVELDASNMDWKTRVSAWLDRVESWCGCDHLGFAVAPTADAARPPRRLVIVDAEYLVPDRAMWSQEIATQHAEMSHLPARFARVPEIVRGSRNDLLLLARDRAEADSVTVGNLIVRNLDASAEKVAQFRLEWSGAEVLSLPGPVLSPAFAEFFPESRPVAYVHFTQVAARNPQIDRLLPIEKFTADELFRRLAKSVIGQDEAMRAIAAIITGRVARRAPDDGRPIASILLPGPTGCGKTETGAALARGLFGRPDSRFIEIKLEQHRLNSHFLFGLEPGYKDVTDEMRREGGGMITRPIIAQPGRLCLFLLDELEKGHEGVPEALFAALDQGWARDGTSGHKVSFRDSIFIVTTNEADEAIRHMADSGASWDELRKATPDLILSQGRHGWQAPFLARFDAVLPLSHPKPPDILRIAEKLTRELLEKHHNFAAASPRFLEWAAAAYQRTLGVRALKRTIEDQLDPQFGALPRDRGRLWLAVDGDGRLVEAA